MIHEKVKEIINAFFAKLGLSNRVDDISTVSQNHIRPTRIRGLINEAANENELRKEANLKIIKDGDVITDSIIHYKSIFTKQDVEKAVKDIPDLTEMELLVQQVLNSNRILELYHDDGESSKYFTTIEVRNEETRIIRIANKINDRVYYNDIYNLKSDNVLADTLTVLTSNIEILKYLYTLDIPFSAIFTKLFRIGEVNAQKILKWIL
ncbi:conjugal transfer protein TraA [Orientia tsutsugamushi]|uniref:Conjugal transfer protein TraA n=1 Tax=Orientia tsutsugamushi TaxID=784 RepID=A0A2R8F093_ORITS|nr:conjugal transfer protein TraA [Orientia tsutsugamushi]